MRLYAPYATQSLMQDYKTEGISLRGYVLSCEPIADGWYELVVAYTTSVTTGRGETSTSLYLQGRLSTTKEEYRRAFQVPEATAKGSVVEMLQLPQHPNSGIPKDSVEVLYDEYSPLGHNCVLVPGVLLLGFIVWSAFGATATMEDSSTAYLVVGFLLSLVVMVSSILAKWRWKMEREQRFFAAVATSRGETGNSKDDALLP